MSEVHTTSVFRVKVYRLVSFCVDIALCFEKYGEVGEIKGDWCLVWASRDSGPVKLCRRPFSGPRSAKTIPLATMFSSSDPFKCSSANPTGALSQLAQRRHQSPLISPPSLLQSFSEQCYIYNETHHPSHFKPEDSGSKYLHNTDNITNIHKV
jgi:hypothetical protein